LIVDVFGGSRIPAHVTSLEFYRLVARALAPDGVVLVNVADGPGLPFARAQTATVRAALGEVIVIAESQILNGRRYGNLVLVGSRTPLPLDWLPRLVAAGPHPARVVSGRQVREFIAT